MLTDDIIEQAYPNFVPYKLQCQITHFTQHFQQKKAVYNRRQLSNHL